MLMSKAAGSMCEDNENAHAPDPRIWTQKMLRVMDEWAQRQTRGEFNRMPDALSRACILKEALESVYEAVHIRCMERRARYVNSDGDVIVKDDSVYLFSAGEDVWWDEDGAVHWESSDRNISRLNEYFNHSPDESDGWIVETSSPWKEVDLHSAFADSALLAAALDGSAWENLPAYLAAQVQSWVLKYSAAHPEDASRAASAPRL